MGIALLAAYAIYEFASSVARAREELGAGLGPLEDLSQITGRAYRCSDIAVRRLDIEIEIDETQNEIDRLQGGLENIQRTLQTRIQGNRAGEDQTNSEFVATEDT